MARDDLINLHIEGWFELAGEYVHVIFLGQRLQQDPGNTG
jgi:hypothetical protein